MQYENVDIKTHIPNIPPVHVYASNDKLIRCFIIGLKPFLRHGLTKTEIYGDKVYKFKTAVVLLAVANSCKFGIVFTFSVCR